MGQLTTSTGPFSIAMSVIPISGKTLGDFKKVFLVGDGIHVPCRGPDHYQLWLSHGTLLRLDSFLAGQSRRRGLDGRDIPGGLKFLKGLGQLHPVAIHDWFFGSGPKMLGCG